MKLGNTAKYMVCWWRLLCDVVLIWIWFLLTRSLKLPCFNLESTHRHWTTVFENIYIHRLPWRLTFKTRMSWNGNALFSYFTWCTPNTYTHVTYFDSSPRIKLTHCTLFFLQMSRLDEASPRITMYPYEMIWRANNGRFNPFNKSNVIWWANTGRFNPIFNRSNSVWKACLCLELQNNGSTFTYVISTHVISLTVLRLDLHLY